MSALETLVPVLRNELEAAETETETTASANSTTGGGLKVDPCEPVDITGMFNPSSFYHFLVLYLVIHCVFPKVDITKIKIQKHIDHRGQLVLQ